MMHRFDRGQPAACCTSSEVVLISAILLRLPGGGAAQLATRTRCPPRPQDHRNPVRVLVNPVLSIPHCRFIATDTRDTGIPFCVYRVSASAPSRPTTIALVTLRSAISLLLHSEFASPFLDHHHVQVCGDFGHPLLHSRSEVRCRAEVLGIDTL
jgi:hypothetical protein